MDRQRFPFGIRVISEMRKFAHIDFTRLEPPISPSAVKYGSGFFYLCTKEAFMKATVNGINNKPHGFLRTHFEPFVPSDLRSSVRHLEWANTKGNGAAPKLVCINIDPAAFLENGVTIGHSGRFSIDAATIISPKSIESAWIYEYIYVPHPSILEGP